MKRATPVTTLPRDLPLLVSALERVLGFAVPLLMVSLVRVEGGLTFTPASGAGTVLLSTKDTTDWLDSGADEWRLVGWAVDSSAVGMVVRYMVNGVMLAQATIPPTTAGNFAGNWTPIPTADRITIDKDQVGHAVVIGDGIGATTIKSLVLQARTRVKVV